MGTYTGFCKGPVISYKEGEGYKKVGGAGEVLSQHKGGGRPFRLAEGGRGTNSFGVVLDSHTEGRVKKVSTLLKGVYMCKNVDPVLRGAQKDSDPQFYHFVHLSPPRN